MEDFHEKPICLGIAQIGEGGTSAQIDFDTF